MNNVHKFEGRPASKKDQYGIQNLEEVRGQLVAQEAAYNEAVKELKEGNLNNIDHLKDLRKVLVDFREMIVADFAPIATDTLERAEVAAVGKQINDRIAELDGVMNETEAKKAKFA